MLILPKSTEIKVMVAKQKIKKMLTQKDSFKTFDNEVSKCYLINEISENTTHISAGKEVKTIYIMQFILKTESFTNKWIEYFSKNTNQNIIFLLDYGAYFQVSVYKEKVLTTDKLSKDIILELKGLDLSKVWDNLIIDIFNINVEQGKTLKEQVQKNNAYEALALKVERLNNKMRKEKQPLKKRELFEEYNRLKKELEQLKNR